MLPLPEEIGFSDGKLADESVHLPRVFQPDHVRAQAIGTVRGQPPAEPRRQIFVFIGEVAETGVIENIALELRVVRIEQKLCDAHPLWAPISSSSACTRCRSSRTH